MTTSFNSAFLKSRTTFRLLPKIHELLKQVALDDKTSADAVVNAVLEQYLRDRGYIAPPRQRDADSWGPDLAELLLQFLPTPAVLKDRTLMILWHNIAFQDLVQFPVIGKTLADVGVVRGFAREVWERNMKQVLESGEPGERLEELFLKEGSVVFRAERFLFGPDQLLGDFSFVQKDIHVQGIKESVWSPTKILKRIEETDLPDNIRPLIVSFVDEAPVPIVIKRAGEIRPIVYANQSYEKLAGKPVVGKTFEEAFDTTSDHEISQNDRLVQRTGLAYCCYEQLPAKFSSTERWSYRFPILAPDGSVKFIGSISPDFLK